MLLGGDPDTFNKINAAYTRLIDLQTYFDELSTTKLINYEVILQKLRDSTGLGISVSEDKMKRQVVVQRVDEKAKIVGITEESGTICLSLTLFIAK